MPPEAEFIFAFLALIVVGVIFLTFSKMFLGFLKERRRGSETSLGTSELEAMLRRAVKEGTAPLFRRIDELEDRLEDVQDQLEHTPRALHEHTAGGLLEEAIETPVPLEAQLHRGTQRTR